MGKKRPLEVLLIVDLNQFFDSSQNIHKEQIDVANKKNGSLGQFHIHMWCGINIHIYQDNVD